MDTIAVLYYLPDPHAPYQARLAALDWYDDPVAEAASALDDVFGRTLAQHAGQRFGDPRTGPRCMTCACATPDTYMALEIWLVRDAQGGIGAAHGPAHADRWRCLKCHKISKGAHRAPLSAHALMAHLDATWARAPQAFGDAFLPSSALAA